MCTVTSENELADWVRADLDNLFVAVNSKTREVLTKRDFFARFKHLRPHEIPMPRCVQKVPKAKHWWHQQPFFFAAPNPDKGAFWKDPHGTNCVNTYIPHTHTPEPAVRASNGHIGFQLDVSGRSMCFQMKEVSHVHYLKTYPNADIYLMTGEVMRGRVDVVEAFGGDERFNRIWWVSCDPP